MRTRTHGDVETWRCDACGAYTDEPLQVCSECQAKRLDGPILSSEKKARRNQKRGVKIAKTKQPRKKAIKSVKPPKSEEPVQDTLQENSKPLEAESDLATVVQPGSPAPPGIDDGIDMPQDSTLDDMPQDSTLDDNPNEFVVRPTDREAAPQDQLVQSLGESPEFTPPSESNAAGWFGDRLSLVYVNTPVPELIKRKLDIDFETFPAISIGRSPENVVVIPDAGVSRTHAELKKDGIRLILTDLQSSNGTYVYDGKEFQRVQDTVEVRPNALVKLGNGTILRIVTE